MAARKLRRPGVLVTTRILPILLASSFLVAACATPATQPGQGTGQPDARPVAAPKRISAAILGDPFTLNAQLNTAGGSTQPGVPELELLVHSGLGVAGEGGMHPQLAENVPSIDGRTWQVSPDGQMETTWRIRNGAQWHDGTAFTAEDLRFTAQVVQDRELAAFRNRVYDLIDRVEALDARTVTVRWKRPYIGADALFSGTSERLAMPLPRHLLEQSFAGDKAAFLEVPYWSDQFVGTGPFKLRSWVRESHLVLQANDQYVLGRPKLDEIEVRFIPDPNAMMASVLAGAVELTTGRGLSVEQAAEVRDLWRDGKLITAPARWAVLFPQFLSPNPPVVADVQFRRALLHAIDRQHMVDTLQKGIGGVAHTFLEPNQPQFRDIEQRVPRYEYDTRRATQMIEALGYARGADGSFRDGTGQALVFEARAPNVGPNEQMLLAVVDFWKRIGLSPETVIIPRQRFGENEYRWTFPGFELTKRPHDVKGIGNLHSSQTPLPETRFLGNNVSRYMNAEFDGLIDRYFAAIPRGERMEALGEIIHQIGDRVLILGLFYDPDLNLAGNRLRNVTGAPSLDAVQTWNAIQWDVQ